MHISHYFINIRFNYFDSHYNAFLYLSFQSRTGNNPNVGDNSFVVDGQDISVISDDELYRMLKEFNVDIGPIVGEKTVKCAI